MRRARRTCDLTSRNSWRSRRFVKGFSPLTLTCILQAFAKRFQTNGV